MPHCILCVAYCVLQVFSLQEKAEEVSTLVVTAEERLKALDKCPFDGKSMGDALSSLQVLLYITV